MKDSENPRKMFHKLSLSFQIVINISKTYANLLIAYTSLLSHKIPTLRIRYSLRRKCQQCWHN